MGRASWKFQVGAIGEGKQGFTQDSPNKARISLISSKDTWHQPAGASLATCIFHCQTNCSLLEVL